MIFKLEAEGSSEERRVLSSAVVDLASCIDEEHTKCTREQRFDRGIRGCIEVEVMAKFLGKCEMLATPEKSALPNASQSVIAADYNPEDFDKMQMSEGQKNPDSNVRADSVVRNRGMKRPTATGECTPVRGRNHSARNLSSALDKHSIVSCSRTTLQNEPSCGIESQPSEKPKRSITPSRGTEILSSIKNIIVSTLSMTALPGDEHAAGAGQLQELHAAGERRWFEQAAQVRQQALPLISWRITLSRRRVAIVIAVASASKSSLHR